MRKDAKNDGYRILDNIIIFLIDPHSGKILDASPSACLFYGYSMEELLNLKIIDINTLKPELVMDKINKAIEGTCNHFFFTHRLKNNDRTDVEVISSPIVINGKKLLYSIVNANKKNSQQPKNKHGSDFIAKYGVADIQYKSSIMNELVQKITLISKSEQTILIFGESGVGKELFANFTHNESWRNNGPFVSVNCAALTQSLMESELFGYSEGAFTGAIKGGKKGKIELAHNGTLFLDEIGDLSPNAQAMLLRVLQEQELMRIGDEKIIKVNIRVICATNKNLKQLCESKQFRWDLYYRLAGFIIEIPPLRERREDINFLANCILADICYKYGDVKKLSPIALKMLENYSWPGNVRELSNFIESAYILTINNTISQETVQELIDVNNFVTDTMDKPLEKENLQEVLESVSGNVTLAAKKMNVSRATIYRWLKNESSKH